MPKLSFSDQLNDSQREYAREIGIKAEEMGIPAELAISIAYQESRLNPNAPRGAKGEFGGMQVMPATGKIMGYTNKDLADPQKNMEAGLKYLKQNLDAFGGDPKLATIGYNAGTDSSFFSGGKMPESTERYLKDVNSYGAFEAAGAATPATPAEAPPEPGEMVTALAPPPPPPKLDLSGASRGEKFLGGAIGAGVGTLAAGAEGISDVMTGRAATKAGAEETARIAARNAAASTSGSAAPGAAPSPTGAATSASGAQAPMRQPAIPAGGNLQPPMGPADAGRMARGQTGAGTYNYAKNLGSNQAARRSPRPID